MRKSVVAMALLLATAAVAEELTVEKIIAAHSFGVTPDRIIAKVNDPTNTVAPILPSDVEKLRAEGVPEPVILAMQARALPAPQPLQPDNPNLTKVVKLVQSGVTESLLIELIEQGQPMAALSHGDIIYLKDNRVPDAVIAALMANSAAQRAVAAPAGAAPAATPTPEPELDAVIDGLVLMRGTFLSKNHEGRLAFEGDDLDWSSATDPKSNFKGKITALERASLRCSPLPGGNFCFEISFKLFQGSEYSFRDIGADQGSNANVTKVREVLQARFPKLVFEEKIEK